MKAKNPDEEARLDPGGMEPPRPWPRTVAFGEDPGSGFGDERGEQRRHHSHRGRREPDRLIARRGQHRLADERPDRQAQIDGQGGEIDPFPTALGRREVGDGREGRDEEERLADAQQRPDRDERRQRPGDQVRHQGHHRDDPAQDEERSATEPVRSPAHHRT